MSKIGNWADWLGAHLPFGINSWPTWANEGIGGLAGMGILAIPAYWWHPWLYPAYWTYLIVSAVYERKWDNHGYNVDDESWRFVGASVAFFSWGCYLWLR